MVPLSFASCKNQLLYQTFIKIIAISGLAVSDKLANLPVVKRFLTKPYTTKELLQTLQNVLYQESKILSRRIMQL